MRNEGLVFSALAVSIACMVAAVLVLPRAQRNAIVHARIRKIRDTSSVSVGLTGDITAGWSKPLRSIGHIVLRSGILSQKAIEDLESTIVAAGYRSGAAVSLFIGIKILLAVSFPVFFLLLMKIAGLTFVKPLYLGIGAAIIGLLLPDYVVRGVRKRYLKSVETGLPAALDLLIICAEAGLALESGFDRVASEFEEAIPATANELRTTANEMKLLSDRRQALLNMGKRTGLDSMYRLGGVLAQSQKYGTPLSQALRVLAAEMRALALTRFEARAGRLPVLLTLPMILFILPCIFVVVAGPAAVQVMHTLKSQ